MAAVTGLGHFGLSVQNLDRMVDFYTRVLGFSVTDGGAPGGGGAFLSAQPQSEHHELVLSVSTQPTNAQQISFPVETIADLRELYRAIVAEGCKIESVTSHGIALACYFRDPEDNVLEIYWPTGIDYPQPVGMKIDLEATDQELLDFVANMPARPADVPRSYGRDLGKRLSPGEAVRGA